MHILMMKFETLKTSEEQAVLREAGIPLFKAMEGLLEKYYVADTHSEEVAGFYIWESRDRVTGYLNGPIVPKIPDRWALKSAMRTDVLAVLDGALTSVTSEEGAQRLIALHRVEAGDKAAAMLEGAAIKLACHNEADGLNVILSVWAGPKALGAASKRPDWRAPDKVYRIHRALTD